MRVKLRVGQMMGQELGKIDTKRPKTGPSWPNLDPRWGMKGASWAPREGQEGARDGPKSLGPSKSGPNVLVGDVQFGGRGRAPGTF